MGNLGAAAGWGAVVAASLLAGAVAAAALRFPPRIAALLTAFGGGVLLAAVAVELVPGADELAGSWVTATGLLAGMLVYLGADAWLTRTERRRVTRRSMHATMAGQRPPRPLPDDAGRGESLAAGIFVDGVPESVALGLTVAAGRVGVALLAGVLVGNVVEAYGAAQPIIAAGRSARFAVALLTGIGLALAAATVLGGTVLADASPSLVGGAEALASGALLAVVSVSIIPYTYAEISNLVAAVGVLGFVTGYLLS
jgi:zinc transporter, ZIP family